MDVFKLASEHFLRGAKALHAGDLDEAESNFLAALEAVPDRPSVLANLSIVCTRQNRLPEALNLIERAVANDPSEPLYWLQKGAVQLRLGEFASALSSIEAAIEKNPRLAEAYNNRGSALKELDRLAEALASYDRAISLRPDYAEAYSNRGNALKELDRIDEAIASYDKAISLKPDYAEAFGNRGNALRELSRFDEALASYDKAISLKPDYAEAYGNRGNALKEIDRLDEALASYDKAIGLKPDYAEAHGNRGNALKDLNRLDEALASYDMAIALKPDYAEAYSNRGTVLIELNRLEEAREDLGQSLQLRTHGNKSAEVMAEHCAKLLSVDLIPAIYSSESEISLTRQRVDQVLDELAAIYEDSPALSADQARISHEAMSNLAGFYLAYHQRNDRETMRKLAVIATKMLSLPRYEPRSVARRSQPIRVGIASARLRDHNGANWAYNWFAQLPRGDYDIFTYNFDSTKDFLSAKFAGLGTHRQLTWSARARHNIIDEMRSDKLDILMLPDVGMTPVSRYLSLHRIAPCQFTAWGHPVTTGSPEMDFYLSSDRMEPENGQDHYTEELVRMPNLALYLDEVEDIPAPASAQDFGLPSGRVLYGCLQSLFKYLPQYDAILPQIALEVPAALFVFLEGKPSYMTSVLKARLETSFAEKGLDAWKHVIFLQRQKPDDFDRLMLSMDVCIDSIGWSGGNTSLKNISLGVPLATFEGEFMRGRHTSAMFRLIGADELICTSLQEYIDRLVRLGREVEFRRHCRELFLENRHRLYRDVSFISAFDSFLKARVT